MYNQVKTELHEPRDWEALSHQHKFSRGQLLSPASRSDKLASRTAVAATALHEDRSTGLPQMGPGGVASSVVHNPLGPPYPKGERLPSL